MSLANIHLKLNKGLDVKWSKSGDGRYSEQSVTAEVKQVRGRTIAEAVVLFLLGSGHSYSHTLHMR